MHFTMHTVTATRLTVQVVGAAAVLHADDAGPEDCRFELEDTAVNVCKLVLQAIVWSAYPERKKFRFERAFSDLVRTPSFRSETVNCSDVYSLAMQPTSNYLLQYTIYVFKLRWGTGNRSNYWTRINPLRPNRTCICWICGELRP